MKALLGALVMTFALGFSTASAFFLIGGRLALMGPYVLAREWPLIYTLVLIFAALVGIGMGWLMTSRSRVWLALVVLGGWVGEYTVVGSGVLAEELTFLNAWGIWLLATAGPLQPVFAWLGAILGQRLRRQAVR